MPAEITDEEILIELRGLPDWITVEAIRETLATWQPYYPEPLTAK
jgi:hypothetical protein